MSPRLRSEIEVTRTPDGVELWDRATGFRIALEGECAFLEQPAAAVEGDASWEELSRVGLVDEGLTLDEVSTRQREARQELAEEARQQRLAELVQFAVARVPYYRARQTGYAFPEGEWESLPFLCKADVRAHFPEGLLADGVDVPKGLADGSLAFATTSGTTGERLQVLADMDLPSFPLVFERLWEVGPFDAPPRTAVLTSPACLGTECHLGRRTFEERLREGNTLFLNSVENPFFLKADLLRNIADELARLAPTFLLANPIYLHWALRRAKEWSVEFPKVPVVLSSYQFLPSASRRAIPQRLGARVYDYYAASDLGGCRVGVECRRGRMHVREDQTHVEVLPLAGGGALSFGTLTVSTVANRVVPLVRYRLGDVGRFSGEECDCEVADWRCLELHGRAKDLLRIGGRWVSTREVDGALADVPGLDFYQLVQTGESEARVQAVPSLDQALDVGAMKERLAGLGLGSVRVEQTGSLEPESSGKFRLTGSRHLSPPEAS